MEVPASPDAITLPWLQSLWPATPLKGFRTEPASGDGLSSVRVRISVEAATADASRTVLAKFGYPGQPEWVYRSAYLAEATVYGSTIVPAGTLHLPHCWFAHCDPVARIFALVLDDIRPGTGGTLKAVFSPAQLRHVVTTLATWHARWWGRSPEEPFLAETEKILLLTGDVERFCAGLLAYLATLDEGPLTSRFMRITGSHLARVVTAHRESLQQGPGCTLVHGDLHPGNLIFPRGGTPATWLDWQTVAYLKGAYDLALLVGLNTPTDTRRRWERHLIDLYLQTLHREGISTRRVGFLTDYRVALLFAGLRWLDVARVLAQRDPRDRFWTRVMVERIASAFEDWDVLAAVGLPTGP